MAGVKKTDKVTMKFDPIVWRCDTIGTEDGVPRVPEARVRDKLGKNHAWSVMESKTDFEGKKFIFNILNGQKVEEKIITFDEACKEFGWKSFKIDMVSCWPKY